MMVAMSEYEAFQQAQGLWGREAHVRRRQGGLAQGEKPYAVGKWIGHHFRIFGQGETWEEAFAAAAAAGQARRDSVHARELTSRT